VKTQGLTNECEFCDYVFDPHDDNELFYHENECPNQAFLWMKGLVDSDDTIGSLADKFNELAKWLQEKQDDGWVLTWPPDNGYVWLGKHNTR
jgi:hypothetical protein